jgi:hypothetical protein
VREKKKKFYPQIQGVTQTGRTVLPLAKEKRKNRIRTYEGGARMKIS